MKDGTFRGWFGRLLWVLPAILVAWGLVRLADQSWYRARIPVTFRDANWSGTWRTANYGGLSGRLLVRLPDPMPEDEDFTAEALVYYPIYSVWRTGRFIEMEFLGRCRPDAPASGSSMNRIPGGGNLKFKGVVGNQTVDYAAISDETGSRIVGGYLSDAPDDYGTFLLMEY